MLNTFRYLLNACHGILAELQLSYPVHGVHVDLSGKGSKSKLISLLVNDGVRGMLEGKDYKSVDIVFRFSAAFLELCTGLVNESPLTTIHAPYKDLMWRVRQLTIRSEYTTSLQEHVQRFKSYVVKVYGPHFGKGLFNFN